MRKRLTNAVVLLTPDAVTLEDWWANDDIRPQRQKKATSRIYVLNLSKLA